MRFIVKDKLMNYVRRMMDSFYVRILHIFVFPSSFCNIDTSFNTMIK